MRSLRAVWFCGLASMAVAASATAAVDLWLNETGDPGEMDWVNLQWPMTMSVNSGDTTDAAYGRVYEAGLTEAEGASSAIIAQWGYGGEDSDPRTSLWTWSSASYNLQIASEDEYFFTGVAPAPGVYSYTYRFSQDGGLSWTLADLDGAGSSSGADFDPGMTGLMTVLPEPAFAAFGALGLLALGRRHRH